MLVGTPYTPDSGLTSKPVSMGQRVKKPLLNGKFKDPKMLSGLTSEDAAIRKAIASITPFRMIVTTLILGLFGFLYISHVFYMQQLHTEVNQLRTQFEQVRIDQLNTQLTYERLTGPAEVYQRSRQLGLIDGGPADRILTRTP